MISRIQAYRRLRNPDVAADDDAVEETPTGAATAAKDKEEMRREQAEVIAARLQGKPLEAVQRMAAAPIVYKAATATHFTELVVYTDVPDVRAAAQAVGLTVRSKDELGINHKKPTVLVSTSPRGAVPGTNKFEFNVPPQRPMILFSRWREQRRKEPNASAANETQKVLNQLNDLAAWIRNNEFNEIVITTAGNNPVRFPTAGDIIYYLALGVGSRKPSAVVTSPFNGAVKEITPDYVVIETDSYTNAFNTLLKDVCVLRAQLFEAIKLGETPRVADIEKKLHTLLPQLGAEANLRYPSLAPGASKKEVERAARLLYATATDDVHIATEYHHFVTTTQAIFPRNTQTITEALSHKATSEGQLKRLAIELQRLQDKDPEAVAALISNVKEGSSGDGSQAKIGDVAGHQLDAVSPRASSPAAAASQIAQQKEQIASLIREEVAILDDKIRRVQRDLRSSEKLIKEFGVEVPQLSAKLVVRARVSLKTPRGVVLPLAAGIDVGASVNKDQALTGVKKITSAPEAALARTQSLLKTGLSTAKVLDPYANPRERAAIENIFEPETIASTQHTKRYIVAYSTQLKPDDVGTFNVAKDGDRAVYAKLISGAPVSFKAFLVEVGGLKSFMIDFGLVTKTRGDTIKAEIANATNPSASLIEAIIKGIKGSTETKDLMTKPLEEWMRGSKNLFVFRLGPDAPEGLLKTELKADSMQLPFIIRPLPKTAGKPVLASAIVKLTLYSFWQTHPTDTAEIMKGTEVVMPVGSDLKKGLTRAINSILDRRNKAQALKAKVEQMKSKDRKALITEQDTSEAARRANRFGQSTKDKEYITNRLLRKHLEEAVSPYTELLEKIEDKEGMHTSAVHKMAKVLQMVNPNLTNSTVEQIIAHYLPTDAEKATEIAAIQEKIGTPNVIEDPMCDTLLVATLAPDEFAERLDCELVVNLKTMELFLGARSGQLAKLIQMFENVDKIGYVPERPPASRQARETQSMFSYARGISQVVASQAARQGQDTSSRGAYRIAQLRTDNQGRSTAVGGGLAIERGRGSPVATQSFGEIGATGGRARRELIASRLSALNLPVPETHVGPTQEELNRQLAQASVRPKRSSQTSVRESTRKIELRVPEMDNPFRLRTRRNPEQPNLADVLFDVFVDIQTALNSTIDVLGKFSGVACSEVGEFTSEEKKALGFVNICSAVCHWAASTLTPEEAKNAEIIGQIQKQIYAKPFLLKVMKENFTPGSEVVALKVGETTRALTKDAKTQIMTLFSCGFFYQSSQGKLLDRNPRQIVLLLLVGPFAASLLEAHPQNVSKETKASINSGLKAERVEVLGRAIENIAETPEGERGPADRTFSLDSGVTQNGFVLTQASKRLLPGFPEAAQAVGTVPELHKKTRDAYSKLIELFQDKNTPADVLKKAVSTYEQNLSLLLKKLEETGEATDVDTRSLVEAKIMHFLSGRTAQGETIPSRETRTQILHNEILRYLDFYGRPVTPIDAQTFIARGVNPPEYGLSLGNRPTVRQAQQMIDRTSGESGKKPIATSTLACSASIGRGVNEFPRPYAGHKPNNWNAQGILNVIWLSPDSQIVRIYRLGAPVCMLRRAKDESLMEFLGEAAENWSLWLTDPRHTQRAQRVVSNVYIGQSGDPNGNVYRINSSGDKVPLSRSSFSRRLTLAGAAIGNDKIVQVDETKIEVLRTNGKIIQWADPQQVQDEARNYLEAMRSAGLIQNTEVEAIFRQLVSPTGGSEQSSEEAPKDTLIVLFPPTYVYSRGGRINLGGTGQVPTGRTSADPSFKKSIIPCLITSSAPFKTIRVYDPSLTGSLRSQALKLALEQINPKNMEAVQSELLSTPAGLLINAVMTNATREGLQVNIIAGGDNTKASEGELKTKSEGAVTFALDGSRLKENQKTELLELALKPSAPILIVEVHDTSLAGAQRGKSDQKRNDGIELIEEVYALLMRQNRATETPVMYVYPESRETKGDVALHIAKMKTAIAAELEVESTAVPLYAVEYKNLASQMGQLFPKSNPRRRMLTQVASQWMRTFPFPG